ncbi:CAP domain-containing protein [Talaromyces proteolyticus]|uniref:CAP domain-containing protein n=1 Tax=Talaromyces proteolyticus TaxID=1131652 RepID=A0AAD4KZD1_9EURO|nr:CAP domain-containing protein [Talaromyces proteolyticus]KAH8703409.1 CAP domain-containing protein [Talaromyces proteolyticus]
MSRLALFFLATLHPVCGFSQDPTTLTRQSTATLQARDVVYFTTIVTVTAQPAHSTTSPSYTNSTQLQLDSLTQTNFYRQQHNASALTWNTTLASYAQNWADHCNWKHSGGPYGENLAEGFSNTTSAIDAWARESTDYSYTKPTGFSEQTGHFTQLVWKATSQLGCAVADCSRNDETFQENGGEAFGWYFLCEYWPPGNVGGDDDEYFKENVDPVVESGVMEGRCVGRVVWVAVVVGVLWQVL